MEDEGYVCIYVYRRSREIVVCGVGLGCWVWYGGIRLFHSIREMGVILRSENREGERERDRSV